MSIRLLAMTHARTICARLDQASLVSDLLNWRPGRPIVFGQKDGGMSSNLTRVLVGATLASGVLVVVAIWPPVALGGIAAGLVIWQLSKCRHTPPLALLPPTLDEHGERQPARWYCDRCGKTWTAVFEHDRVPVQRFTGYDQTKAAEAAKRAAELAERQQALALKRAGFAPRTTPVARRVQKPAAVRSNPPVPIHGRRIAG